MSTIVRLDGANADILLPPGADLPMYVQGIRARSLFKVHPALAARSSTIRSSTIEAPRTSPYIAITVAHPDRLIPGEDPDTDHLIALVKNLGCRPLLVPPCADVVIDASTRHEALHAMTHMLDGILGPGGDDVDPRLYGESRSAAVQETHYLRDRFEADFALTAREQHLFMFGICRSHQLWNAAFGGSLVQDVRVEGRSVLTQDQEAHGIPLDQPFIVRWPDGTVRLEHRVHIAPGSWLGAALKVESMLTNSYHHQAVDVPGRGMRVVGVVRDEESKKDTIEVTEDWNVITTQFHPELMQSAHEQKTLFGMLGRRAHVFWALRSLRNEGAVSTDALVARLYALPSGLLADDDWTWVNEALVPRLSG
jgi:putative glutamine amidotransferase